MQPSAAVLCLQTMNDTQFHDHFHTVEVEMPLEQRSLSAAIAGPVLVAVGLAAVAAWRSPLGRKARNKIAAAIKAD